MYCQVWVQVTYLSWSSLCHSVTSLEEGSGGHPVQTTAQSRTNLGARSNCSGSCPAKFLKSLSLEVPQPLLLQSINHFNGENFFTYALLEFAFLCCLPSACKSCLSAVGEQDFLGRTADTVQVAVVLCPSRGTGMLLLELANTPDFPLSTRSSSPSLQLPSCSVPSLCCHLGCSALWISFSCHHLLLDSSDATHIITFLHSVPLHQICLEKCASLLFRLLRLWMESRYLVCKLTLK